MGAPWAPRSMSEGARRAPRAPCPARPARIGLDAHLLSFATSYRQAGVSRYIAELLRAFAAEGGTGAGPMHEHVTFAGGARDGVERARQGAGPAHEYIAFAGPGRPPPGFLPAGSGPVRWRHSQLPTARAPVRIAWEQAVAPVAAWRERLDLLHGPVNVLPAALPCPGVVTIHDVAFLAYPEAFHPAKRRYLTALTGLSARRAARVIAVSGHTRDEVVRRLGVPGAKVTVIPNAADPRYRPLPADEVARFRAEQGLP